MTCVPLQNACLMWQNVSQDLLALEPRRSHRELPFLDRITVHRKGVPGHDEDEPLAHELRCFPNNPQVPLIFLGRLVHAPIGVTKIVQRSCEE